LAAMWRLSPTESAKLNWVVRVYPHAFWTLQRGHDLPAVMDSVLGSLPFAFIYLDDILIASPDAACHRRHREANFAIQKHNGSLSIQTSVCSNARPWSFWAITLQPWASVLFRLGCRPLPIFLPWPLLSSCRCFWVSTTYIGASSHLQHV
jgi:hypothetical protein